VWCQSESGSHDDTLDQRIFLREMLPGVPPCGLNRGTSAIPPKSLGERFSNRLRGERPRSHGAR